MAKRRNTDRDDHSYEDKRRRESSRNRRNLCRDERARRRSKENRERYERHRGDNRDKYSPNRHSNRKYKDVVSSSFDVDLLVSIKFLWKRMWF